MENNPDQSRIALDGLLQRVHGNAGKNREAASPGLTDAAFRDQLLTSVLAEVAAFTDSSNPQIEALLLQHLRDLTGEINRLLCGESQLRIEFVEEFSRRTAEQYFPLEALLHAYRVCLKVLLRTLAARQLSSEDSADRGHLAAVADFLVEFLDSVSVVATAHHVDQTRLLADVASDLRGELLTILLSGYDESDRRVARILRDAGYVDRRLAYCVILVQSVDPAEMNNAARARRLADYIDRLLVRIPGKRLVDIHRNKVTIVFSYLRRLSGWSAPQESLAQRVAQELVKIGTAARTGISNEVSSTSQIPAAYQQAELAFNVSTIGQRVVQFGEIPLQQLLHHFAGDSFLRVLPDWAQDFYAGDAQAKRRLTQTIEAFANANMNVLQTAQQLHLHPNTIYARFNRIRSLSGRDPRQFHHLTELLIVIANADRSEAH